MRRITFILQMARDKKGFFAFSFLPFILSLNLISDSVRLSHIKQFLIITEINWFCCCCCCFSCSCFSLLFYRLRNGFWYPGIRAFLFRYSVFWCHITDIKYLRFLNCRYLILRQKFMYIFFTFESMLAQWSKYANHWEVSQRLAHGQRSYGEFALFCFGLFLVWFVCLFVCFLFALQKYS